MSKAPLERSKKQSALHLVSAWAGEHRLLLGQVKVENKSNEITAIPALLELLDISGCIVTIDAMGTREKPPQNEHSRILRISVGNRVYWFDGCARFERVRCRTQTAIAQQMVAKGADYVLSLKANHPTLYAQVKGWFETAQSTRFEGMEYSYDQRVEAGHHRQEHRQIWVVPRAAIPDLYQPSPWAGLQSIVMVSDVASKK